MLKLKVNLNLNPEDEEVQGATCPGPSIGQRIRVARGLVDAT